MGASHRPPLTDTVNKRHNEGGGAVMSALLIEPILDRYIALVEKRERDWSPREVEALLLKLREEVLQCLKT